MPNERILMLAGESSGDVLGAHLATELLRLKPDLTLEGMGGDHMKKAGVKIILPNDSLDIMGWWGILKNWSIIRNAMHLIKNHLREHRPDLLILIDYPGFNLRMAKVAKKLGIKVLYYVSPQIWAWRYHRIKTIQHCVNHMVVLFPFEEDIYKKENVPVTYVGHPLVDNIKVTETPDTIYQKYNLDPKKRTIALFPGSRHSEIQRLLPIIIAATQKISQQMPDVQFALPLANSLKIEDIKSHIPADIPIIQQDTYNLLSVCDAAIVKSGTSTLEVALSQVPLVIIYKGNILNYWIARAVVHVKQIGLCNIVAQKKIAQELIQHEVTADNISNEVMQLLKNTTYRNNILADLKTLQQNMSHKNSSLKVAELSLKLICNSNCSPCCHCER